MTTSKEAFNILQQDLKELEQWHKKTRIETRVKKER
jgi:hypothetical protein